MSAHMFFGSHLRASEQASTASSSRTGAGQVTVLYDGSSEAPTDAGTYAVTFDVAKGLNYEAATGLAYGSLKINKTPYPLVISDEPPILFRGGSTLDLKDYASCSEGTMRFAITGGALGCSVTSGGVFTSGGNTGNVTVTVTVPGNRNGRYGIICRIQCPKRGRRSGGSGPPPGWT